MSANSNGLGKLRAMAYGKMPAPSGSGLGGGVGKATDMVVRKSRPKRLVTALRRGMGLG